MQKQLVAFAVIGVVLVISGCYVSYYGTQRTDQTLSKQTFIFGSALYIDYSANETYQDGGTANIYLNSYGDQIEISPIQPPSNYNGSIDNFYYLVWDGGAEGNLPGNAPTSMIPLSDLPQTFQPTNHEVSFEIIANPYTTTYFFGIPITVAPSNVSLYIPPGIWEGTFSELHTIPADCVLFFLGMLIILCGAIVTLSSIRTGVKERKGTVSGILTDDRSLPPPPDSGTAAPKRARVGLGIPAFSVGFWVARMRVPKMVKNGLNSSFRIWRQF